MQFEDSTPQNCFLNTVRKDKECVQVYLVNGVKLVGSIASFDQYVVMLSTPAGMQTIYKHAISTIQSDMGARDARSGIRSEHTSFGSDSRGPTVVTRKRRPMAAGRNDA
ncbi:RNA chaperone Hfq [Cupriavidus basilensis]|uniref:RNA-binding protein Hfq n=1 Tax=Cupriavidus basilensis TaxID=68895 RepID=A0ABT6ASY1_9BURK|nr:RNA chaperone Hfq [Cupriavidus basilensis]MDF3835698.1 RNA chaperone Hfq [Cupriavidus basilensis]